MIEHKIQHKIEHKKDTSVKGLDRIFKVERYNLDYLNKMLSNLIDDSSMLNYKDVLNDFIFSLGSVYSQRSIYLDVYVEGHRRATKTNETSQLTNKPMRNDNLRVSNSNKFRDSYFMNDSYFILEKSGHSPVFPSGMFSISMIRRINSLDNLLLTNREFNDNFFYFGGTLDFIITNKIVDDKYNGNNFGDNLCFSGCFIYVTQIKGIKDKSYKEYFYDLLDGSVNILSSFGFDGIVVPKSYRINGYNNPVNSNLNDGSWMKNHKRRLDKIYNLAPLRLGFNEGNNMSYLFFNQSSS